MKRARRWAGWGRTGAGLAAFAAGLAVWGCVSTGETRRNAPEFTEEPSAALEGNQVKIRFGVSRPTDVAVLIRDSDGNVVRHLAAGQLGPQAPAPLAPSSTAQSLAWDRTDDAGWPVPGGRYSVEVGLGLTAGDATSIGWDPKALGRVHGLAVTPAGDLYVMSEGDFGFCNIRAFDGKGRYLRTLAPRSSALPFARAKALGELALAGGERIPCELLPEYGSDTRQTPVVTGEGDLVFVNGPGRGHPEGHRFRSNERGQQPARRLLRLAADGGAPAAGYRGPLLGKGFEGADLYLAPAPDGKSLFVSGARHAIFLVPWGRDAQPVAVAGTPDAPGEEANLRDPKGIALDAEGNLYVADRGNHRVAIFAPGGKLLGEIPSEWPRQVLVHHPTGAVYVVCGFRNCKLVRYDSMRSRKVSMVVDLCSTDPVLAMDPKSAKPMLYAGNVRDRGPDGKSIGLAVVRLVDSGDEIRKDVVVSWGTPLRPFLMGADSGKEWVYAFPNEGCAGGYVRFDGRSGRMPDLLSITYNNFPKTSLL